jgi:hypothetical protein
LNLFGWGCEPTVSGTASEPSKNKECLEFYGIPLHGNINLCTKITHFENIYFTIQVVNHY